MIQTLDVHLWGRKAGTLVSVPHAHDSRVCFYFDPAFCESGLDIAPLKCPISGTAPRRGLPVYPEPDKEFGGLPSFIADSLPDHWGNIVFREWARAHHIRTNSLSPLDRLAYIGRRGIGALEFVPPASATLEEPFRVEVAELVQFARRTLDEANNFHTVIRPGFMVENLFKVGTSAGGRRPKAVINMNLLTGECYSGQVPGPKEGLTPLIIKFDEHIAVPSTRIEYSFYLMARDAGLTMMPCHLMESGDEQHFLTERFDRRGNDKIHVQTLAAMCPYSSSYDDLLEVAIRLSLEAPELRQLFLQMTMNAACGNVDDHNKNFSFLMARDGVWHAAPAYDFTFTVNPSAPFYVNRHSMDINGKTEGVTRDDLLAVAARHGIKGTAALIDKAVEAALRYRQFGEAAGVSEPWIRNIEAEVEQRVHLLKRK